MSIYTHLFVYVLVYGIAFSLSGKYFRLMVMLLLCQCSAPSYVIEVASKSNVFSSELQGSPR